MIRRFLKNLLEFSVGLRRSGTTTLITEIIPAIVFVSGCIVLAKDETV